MRRIIPPIWVLVSLLLMTALHLVAPFATVLPAPFGLVIGAMLIVFGVLLVAWPARLFSRAGTTIRPFQESSALVISGPYRLTRNPIYVGMVLGLTGFALLLGSLTPLIVVPLFALLIDRVFIVHEERMLESQFAHEYEVYCHRVRRWI